MLSTSTIVELMKRFVTLEVPKVAMSEAPFGTVLGTQFPAVVQSALEGFKPQVALPASVSGCAARNSSVAAMTKVNLFIQMLMDERTCALRQRCTSKVALALAELAPSSGALQLRHDGERKIVTVAAFVAGLEIVAVYHHDSAIRQIAERPADGISARVIDQSQS